MEQKPIRCPKCGSLNITAKQVDNEELIFREYHCNECDYFGNNME